MVWYGMVWYGVDVSYTHVTLQTERIGYGVWLGVIVKTNPALPSYLSNLEQTTHSYTLHSSVLVHLST